MIRRAVLIPELFQRVAQLLRYDGSAHFLTDIALLARRSCANFAVIELATILVPIADVFAGAWLAQDFTVDTYVSAKALSCFPSRHSYVVEFFPLQH